MGQSIKKNFIYNALLNVSAVLFPFITAPYVARVLEPDGVGLFNFANTYAGYFALVALLGIPTYGVREISKVRGDKHAETALVSQLMSIAAITTFGISIIFIASLFLVNQLSQCYYVFFLAGFVVYLAPFRINWYYQGIEDFGFLTKISIFIRTISVVCLFIFVREKEDVIYYVLLNVIITVLPDLYGYLRLRRLKVYPRFTLKGLKIHIRPLLILLASSIAMTIYTVLDTLMLGFIRDYTEVGYYNSSVHISKAILAAVTSLSIVVVPRVSYYIKEKDYLNINILVNKSFSFVSFLAFPIAIGLASIASVFIPLFFGYEFLGAIIPLMILSMLIIIIGLNNLMGIQILIGMGYDRLFFYSVLTGAISNFCLNSVLIPFWGAIGASISSVIAEFLILLETTYFVYKKTKVQFSVQSDLWKSGLGALLLIPLLIAEQLLCEGWCLVVLYTFTGALSYFVIEFLIGNTTSKLLLCSMKNLINKVL